MIPLLIPPLSCVLFPALEGNPVAEAEAEAGGVTITALVDAITSRVFDTSGVVSEGRTGVGEADDTISLDDDTTWVGVTEVDVGVALVVATEEIEIEAIAEVEVGCTKLLTTLDNPGTTGMDGRRP